MVELHTRYQAGIPVAYIYGEKPYATLALNNGGGYPTAEEALRAYTRKKMELARQAESRKAMSELKSLAQKEQDNPFEQMGHLAFGNRVLYPIEIEIKEDQSETA